MTHYDPALVRAMAEVILAGLPPEPIEVTDRRTWEADAEARQLETGRNR